MSSGQVERLLERDVRTLSEDFADRNAQRRDVLNAAGDWVAQRFAAMGYSVSREPVLTAKGAQQGFNVVAELGGVVEPERVVVIGAHYDAVPGSPGADDNASGVAVLLELARRFAQNPQDRTVRWVAFTNEETPSSNGGLMGSYVHARDAKDRGEDITAMLSLEMLGYYDEAPGSQRYPVDPAMAARLGLELPDTGDFIGVVGRFEDRLLVDEIGGAMRGAGSVRTVEAALPAIVTAIWRSDQGSFWLNGYTGVMVTDTSEFRTPHYHKRSDTYDTLDYARMAGVADALEAAVRTLGGAREHAGAGE